MMWTRTLTVGLVAACLAAAGTPLLAKGKAADAKKDEPSKAEKLAKAYDEAVEDSTKLDGYLRLRRKEGKLYADLSKGDLKKPFLLFAQIARGISRGDLLGGSMWSMSDEWVLEFHEVDERILLVRKNIRFKADKGSPLDEAVKISFSDSVLASLPLVGKSKGGRRLVELDDVFLSDILAVGSSLKDAVGSGYSLSSRLSNWSSVKVFPENVELEANLTFQGGEYRDLETVPDSRYVTLTVHYSLVGMPDGKYKPRKADDRVGHFLTALKDYSSDDLEGPFVRYVNRWRLEKADPKAKRSTVKNPIIFYLEKSIPYEYRPYVRAGILEWNRAFEAIGYLDAIEVRLQGKDAEWDPEDVRYNTIRWITSPYTFAVGPSHTNPLTGEILDADILIDASWIRYWQREIQLYDLAEDARQAWGLAPPAAGTRRASRDHRDFARGFSHNFALGAMQVLAAAEGPGEGEDEDGETKDEKEEDKGEGGLPMWYIGSGLKDLVMHEVGHTLGLRHNFKASSIRDQKGLHDAALTRGKGLVGSVMDYLSVNLAPPGKDQGEYHPSTLGPYDYWAIEYAYDGKADLAKVAARAAEPELVYASDEDVHPVFDRNLDPLAATWDIGADPLAFAESQLAHVKALWPKILDRVVPEGASYTRARRAVAGLLWEVYNGGRIAARHVGGQFHHRDHKGDPNERPAFVPVPADLQRRALAFLGDGIFSDDSYQLSPELLNHLAPSHWWHWGASPFDPRLDFPFHERVQRLQQGILYRLLNPNVLDRIMDGERKVAADADYLGVTELVGTLTKMIFEELETSPKEKRWTTRKPYISGLRRNLQRTYVSILSQLVMLVPAIQATDSSLVARAELASLRTRLEKQRKAGEGRLDVVSAGHLEDLAERARQVLEAKREVMGY